MSEQSAWNSFVKPTEKGKANKVQRKQLVKKTYFYLLF